jgi:hypothetical protein
MRLVTKAVVTSMEWTLLAMRVAREAAARFPDLEVRHEAGGIRVRAASGAVVGTLSLVPAGEATYIPRFRIETSPASAASVSDARALYTALGRLTECAKWLEARLDCAVFA